MLQIELIVGGARTQRRLAMTALLAGLAASAGAMAQQGVPTAGPAAPEQRAGYTHASVVISSKNANPPRYPPSAFRENKEGEAIMLIKVDAKGQWLSATVLQSTGWPELDEAAQVATQKWQFNAASQDGVPVPGEVRVPMVFKMN